MIKLRYRGPRLPRKIHQPKPNRVNATAKPPRISWRTQKIWIAMGVFFIANIALSTWLVDYVMSHHVIKLTFPTYKEDPWWAKIPWQAIATLIGGGVLLYTYLGNRRQQREHFDRTSLQQSEHFDRQELQAEFKDILDRFSDGSALMRANAANRLSDIAQKHLPGQPLEFTPENYPFYGHASAQLAAALHMEDDAAVRKEVVGAVGRIADFAAQNNARSLLLGLIGEMADANRSAKDLFAVAFGDYCSSRQEPAGEPPIDIGILTPFCDRPSLNISCILHFTLSALFTARASVHRAIGKSEDANGPGVSDRALLMKLVEAGKRLIDTRDALGACLIRLGKHDISESLNLRACFLAGCYLNHVQLSHADLTEAELCGAHLGGAQLQSAVLERANMQGVYMGGGNLSWANLRHAQLSDAELGGVGLQNADLSKSDLHNAHLEGAHLQNSRFWRANLANANLDGAQLKDTNMLAANLSGTRLSGIIIEGNVDLMSSNWRDANFEDPQIGGRDNELWEQLARLYPLDETETE